MEVTLGPVCSDNRATELFLEVIDMNSLVIYGSRHGNTRKLAEAIAVELGKHTAAQLMPAEKVPSILSPQTDLVVVGGPTEAHQMTAPVGELFARLSKDALDGKRAAAFDTRLRWPKWLSGSAGGGIVRELERAGARVLAPEVSFFVTGQLPVLEPGELERAAAWAASLAARMESKELVAAGL
jgi:flavodoxin